jgi:hypothetical protein
VATSCLNSIAGCQRWDGKAIGDFNVVKGESILVKPLVMNNPTHYSLSIILGLLLSIQVAAARPLDFKEVSLLVRVGEPEAAIKAEVAERKLMRPLNAQEETTLKSQGASDSLISSLRNANVLASKEEAAAASTERSISRGVNAGSEMPMHHGPRVHVFNIAFGHPINLSQWGGLDYEIAFNSYRFAGEDHVQASFVDPIGTRTEVSRVIPSPGLSESELVSQDWFPSNAVRSWRYTPYDVRGDVRDARFNFSDTVSVSSQSVTRPTRIDWDNPVYFEGQAYTFYPVYGAGRVSLYYIGRASDSSATVAIVSHGP